MYMCVKIITVRPKKPHPISELEYYQDHQYHSIKCVFHTCHIPLSLYSPVNLGCFQFFVITINTAMNIFHIFHST